MARAEGRGHRLEIDLGLAGAGHPVEDGDREGRGGDALPQRARGAVLVRREVGARPVRIGTAEGRDLGQRDRLDGAEAGQAAHRACAARPSCSRASTLRRASVMRALSPCPSR